MAHVVAEPCINCKYTDCVQFCPVGCFREGVNFIVIDPEECIDCGVCADECPVHAIYPEEEVPEQWCEYIQLNRDYARVWPPIKKKKDPLPAAEEFKDTKNKRHLLDPRPGSGS